MIPLKTHPSLFAKNQKKARGICLQSEQASPSPALFNRSSRCSSCSPSGAFHERSDPGFIRARATIVVKKFVAKINACASNTLTNRGYLIGEINIQRVDSNGPSSRRGNNVVVREKGARRSLRVRRQEIAGPSSERKGSAREGARKRSTPGPVVVLSAGGGGGGGGGGGCRRRDLERRGGGGRGAPCLATISSSVAGSAGGCGPVVGLPSYKKRQGSGAAWGRGSRGRGRGRGGGASLLGSGVAPANYNSGLQGVAPELREVVNILGERNQVGTLTGVGPPPGALDSDGQGDEEEGTSTKRPPRPLYRRLIDQLRPPGVDRSEIRFR
ncbi:hypothetical protein HZU67_01145 [Apis mellifera carnica]|nr:hypothetical protein HZU67_01145 [Apis mellifera carnica]